MMEQQEVIHCVRIVLTSYTASFRVPYLVGHQLTLPVPPLSTIFGLISAAAGRWVAPDKVKWLAYRCVYKEKANDLETIYTVERPRPDKPARFVTSNVIQREFLALPRLTLYLPQEWEPAFQRPRYSLLLGRTQDVGGTMSISHVKLVPVNSGTVGGVLLPFELVALNNASAWLQRLPISFTDEPKRSPTRMHLFGVVDCHRPTFLENGNGWLVKDADDETILILFRKEWMLSSERTLSEIK